MIFKNILLENTNLPEDVIDVILDYKKQIDKPLDTNFFENYNNIYPFFSYLDDNINFHDFIYYLKYYGNQFKLKNINFKIMLIYVDDCDYHFSIKYDDFFFNKTFNDEQLFELLKDNFNYLYISHFSLSIPYNSTYMLNIKLVDPDYEKVFKEKNKFIKKIKKFFYNIRRRFF